MLLSDPLPRPVRRGAGGRNHFHKHTRSNHSTLELAMARPAGTSRSMFDNDDDEEEEEEYRPETDMDELREAAADAEFAGGSKQQSGQDSSKEAARTKIE